jgi:hypothetical protein
MKTATVEINSRHVCWMPDDVVVSALLEDSHTNETSTVYISAMLAIFGRSLRHKFLRSTPRFARPDDIRRTENKSAVRTPTVPGTTRTVCR